MQQVQALLRQPPEELRLTQKEVDATEFGKTKKLIARIKTVIREKELAK